MATIQGSIVLFDRFSPVMRTVLKSVDAVIDAMATCGGVSSGAMENARRAVIDAQEALDTFTTQSKTSGDGFSDAEKKARGVTQERSRWNPALMNAASALSLVKTGFSAVKSVWSGISGLLDASDVQSRAEVQLGTVMANMGGTYEGFGKVRDTASALQGKTTFGDEALLAGAAEIGTYLSDADAIAALMPTLADYAAGMGGPEASAEQMTQYATNLAKTFVGAFDAMNEKGFVFSDAQKKIMKTGTEMEKVAVLSEVIGESWGGLSEKFAQTPQGQLISLQNTLGDMKETMGAELYPYVQELIGVVLDHLPEIQLVLDGITSALQSGVSLVSGFVIPVIPSAIQGRSGNLEGIRLALLIVGAVALAVGAGMAVAWAVANWPLIVLAMLILQLVNYLNTCGVAANDVANEIGASFGWLYGVLYNVFANVYNVVASVAEFFMNVWNDPITAVQRLFYDLCDSILGVLQTIANAIDAVFGTGLGTAVGNFRSQLQTWGDQTIPENKIQLERMDMIDAADAMQRGSEFAGTLLSGLDRSGLGAADELLEGLFGSGGGVPVTGPGGGAVQTTGEVNLADEDLRYILDATERRYIAYVNLETAAPSIQVTFGDVHETADLDDIESALSERLNAALPALSPVGAGTEAQP